MCTNKCLKSLDYFVDDKFGSLFKYQTFSNLDQFFWILNILHTQTRPIRRGKIRLNFTK